MKVDFDMVNSVFIDAVVDQAEMKGVDPTRIALVLFPMKRNSSYTTRVKIFSLVNEFETEVVKLRKITMYDMTGHISKAIMKIFEHEVSEHNLALEQNRQIETTLNFGQPIDLDKIECYIQVNREQDGNYKLDMTFTYDYNLLRKYNIAEEFSDVANEEF